MANERLRVELPIADVRTPITDGVPPPASKDPSALPFRDRSWPDFERILLQYAEHVDGLRSVRIYGLPGQAQHGIDMYGSDASGQTVAYQAKNVTTFTAASLRAAVKKFNNEPPPILGVRRLVLCTACRTDDTKIGEELARQRGENPKLKIDLYDERTLSEGLRGRPDLVRRLFGAAWQVVFCEGASWVVPARSPIDALADSLVRGPLEAHGLIPVLNQARSISETDPARAADLLGQIITKVTEAGFPGTTGILKRERAELLVNAGQSQEATSLLAELAWSNRTSAAIDDDLHAKGRLRELAKSQDLPLVKVFSDTLDAVDQWYRLPQTDLHAAADLSVHLHDAGHRLSKDLVLWVAETGVADRQTWRDGPLIDALWQLVAEGVSATGLSDELNVRLRAAAADLGGDWTDLLRDARAGRLGARMATLVHARYGRHLYLHAQPDDAQAEYSAAVQAGCQAQLGSEAADALFSIAQVRALHGPLEEDVNSLRRMAIDLRRQGHTYALLPGRDPADAGAEALASSDLPSAFRHYRASIRHSVIRGDAVGELNAHLHVADILLRSGEPIAAVPHIIRCGSSELVNRFTVLTYVDLRGDVLDGSHWERASAMTIVAAESDLVPNDQVNDYVAVALAATSEPRRSYFGPDVSLMAWKVIASLSDRLTEADSVAVLTLLDALIDRQPNQYRHTDDDHIAAVARIYDTHPSLVPRAAAHLAQMALQDFNLGETVRHEVRRSIADPDLLLDSLRPHAPSSEAASRLLGDYGELVNESLTGVAQRIEAVLNAPAPQPGNFAFLTDLPNLAQRARGLNEQIRDRLITYCMTLAEDETRPSSNRSEGMEGVLLLADSVDESDRSNLFVRALQLAHLDLPPTAVDRMLDAENHPLSSFKVNLNNGGLSGYALRAAARIASTFEQAEAVQDRVVAWLTGDEHAINAVAHALNDLDPTFVTVDLAVLASHPSPWLRQIAVLLAARSSPPAAHVLRPLAADQDPSVRSNVSHLLSRIAASDEKLAIELRDVLRSDASWMVRKAAFKDPSS